jgi:hypothetical protein
LAPLAWGLALFLAAQLALNLYLDFRRPERRDLVYGLKLKLLRRQVETNPGRPLVLALGGSRVEWGLRPDALPPLPGGPEPVVFNFGVGGAGPFAELLYLRRLLDAGVRPDGVLLEVAPPLLTVNCAGPEWLPVHRLAWSDLPLAARYRPDRRALLLEWGWARLAPCHSYRFALLNALAPRWVPVDRRLNVQDALDTMDDCGWGGRAYTAVTAEERERNLEKARREYQDRLAHFAFEPAADRALREALTLCRERKVPAALFLMPEGSTFAAFYRPGARAAIDAYVAGLCRDFAVPLVDARDWLADDQFWDNHHLLAGGAAAFTRRFGPAALPLVLPRR